MLTFIAFWVVLFCLATGPSSPRCSFWYNASGGVFIVSFVVLILGAIKYAAAYELSILGGLRFLWSIL